MATNAKSIIDMVKNHEPEIVELHTIVNEKEIYLPKIYIIDFAVIFGIDAVRALIGYIKWSRKHEIDPREIRYTIIHDINLRTDPKPDTCSPRSTSYLEYYKEKEND